MPTGLVVMSTGLVQLDIEQSDKLLAGVHIPLDDATLGRGPGIRNLHHGEACNRHSFHPRRIRAIEIGDRGWSQRLALAVTLKVVLSVEEEIDCHPERPCIL